MKKILNICLCMALTAVFSVSAYAYEFSGDSLFSVDIPESYEQTGNSEGNYTFSADDGSSFTVLCTDNTAEDEVFCVSDMTKKEIKNYSEMISSSAEEVIAEYCDSVDVEIVSADKEKINGDNDAVVIRIKTTVTKDGKTETYYQKMAEFGGINNKFTFTYTTGDESRKTDFDTVFSSIAINEAQVRSTKEQIAVYAVAAVIASLIVVGIVKFIKTPSGRKK